MADETEGEKRCKSDSGVAAALSPCTDSRSPPFPLHKKPLVGLKRKGKASLSSTTSSSVGLRNPNLSDCHVCGFRTISTNNKGNPKLQTLDSQWRIVLLCEKCLCSIQSAKICSYCFMEMSSEAVGGVSCFDCKCRVHEGCVSMYRGFGLGSSSFTCIDCWVPKSLNRVIIRRKKKPKGAGDTKVVDLNASSVKSSSVSQAGGNAKSLEDLVRDANSTAQTKIATAARAREKALKKGLAARKVAELAQNALDLLTARGKTELKDPPVYSNSVVEDDVQLAFRLHRAMNSSPRISKISCQFNTNHLVSRKMLRCNGDSLGKVSGGCHSASGKVEGCSDKKIFENTNKAVPEVSVRIGMLDHDSSTRMEFMEASKTADTRETPQDEERKENGEDSVRRNNDIRLNEGLMLDNEDCKLVQPVKEEQASCSNKASSSCGDDNSMNTGDQFFQKQVGLDNNFSLAQKHCLSQ